MADSPLLTALILDSPMCLACIAKNASMTIAAAEAALTVLGRAISISGASRTCQGCGVPGTVYFVERSHQPGDGR